VLSLSTSSRTHSMRCKRYRIMRHVHHACASCEHLRCADCALNLPVAMGAIGAQNARPAPVLLIPLGETPVTSYTLFLP